MGLLGSPGRVFPHCGPLVLAPSLVVAGLSAHREVAQFCSAHWGLALLYVSPERHGMVPSGGVWEDKGRAELLVLPDSAATGIGTYFIFGIQDFPLIHLVSLTFTLFSAVP